MNIRDFLSLFPAVIWKLNLSLRACRKHLLYLDCAVVFTLTEIRRSCFRNFV